MTEIELFLIVDEDGSYTVATEADDAWDQAENDGFAKVRRLILINVKVPPVIAIEATVVIPEESGKCSVNVK